MSKSISQSISTSPFGDLDLTEPDDEEESNPFAAVVASKRCATPVISEECAEKKKIRREPADDEISFPSRFKTKPSADVSPPTAPRIIVQPPTLPKPTTPRHTVPPATAPMKATVSPEVTKKATVLPSLPSTVPSPPTPPPPPPPPALKRVKQEPMSPSETGAFRSLKERPERPSSAMSLSTTISGTSTVEACFAPNPLATPKLEPTEQDRPLRAPPASDEKQRKLCGYPEEGAGYLPANQNFVAVNAVQIADGLRRSHNALRFAAASCRLGLDLDKAKLKRATNGKHLPPVETKEMQPAGNCKWKLLLKPFANDGYIVEIKCYPQQVSSAWSTSVRCKLNIQTDRTSKATEAVYDFDSTTVAHSVSSVDRFEKILNISAKLTVEQIDGRRLLPGEFTPGAAVPFGPDDRTYNVAPDAVITVRERDFHVNKTYVSMASDRLCEMLEGRDRHTLDGIKEKDFELLLLAMYPKAPVISATTLCPLVKFATIFRCRNVLAQCEDAMTVFHMSGRLPTWELLNIAAKYKLNTAQRRIIDSCGKMDCHRYMDGKEINEEAREVLKQKLIKIDEIHKFEKRT